MTSIFGYTFLVYFLIFGGDLQFLGFFFALLEDCFWERSAQKKASFVERIVCVREIFAKRSWETPALQTLISKIWWRFESV